MRTSRRTFINCASLAAAGNVLGLRPFGALNALAQSSGGYKALVCVFLFGGNDANNTIVPLDTAGYANYAQTRSYLALPQSQLLPLAVTGGTGLLIAPAVATAPALTALAIAGLLVSAALVGAALVSAALVRSPLATAVSLTGLARVRRGAIGGLLAVRRAAADRAGGHRPAADGAGADRAGAHGAGTDPGRAGAIRRAVTAGRRAAIFGAATARGPAHGRPAHAARSRPGADSAGLRPGCLANRRASAAQSGLHRCLWFHGVLLKLAGRAGSRRRTPLE